MNLIKNKYFKRFVSLVPVIALTMVSVFSVIYTFTDWGSVKEMESVYRILSNTLGFSLASVAVCAYFVFAYDFCKSSKIAIPGLFFYNIVNIAYDTSKAIGYVISDNLYMQLIEFGGLGFFTLSSIYLFLRNK